MKCLCGNSHVFMSINMQNVEPSDTDKQSSITISSSMKHVFSILLFVLFCFFYLQTLVEETSSSEVYKDTHSILSEVSQEITSKTSFGLSFKLTPTDTSTQADEKEKSKLAEFNAGFNTETERTEMFKTITEHSNTKVKKMLLTF